MTNRFSPKTLTCLHWKLAFVCDNVLHMQFDQNLHIKIDNKQKQRTHIR